MNAPKALCSTSEKALLQPGRARGGTGRFW